MRFTVTGEAQNIAAQLGAGRHLIQNLSTANILVSRKESGISDEAVVPAGSQVDFRLEGQEYQSSQLWVRLEDEDGDDVEVTSFRSE